MLAAGLAATVTVAAPSAAAPTAPATPAARVLLVSAPFLTWADMAEHRLPAIGSLLRRSAVASMSVRTTDSRTSLGDGYVTVGAGNRATAGDGPAGLVLAPSEPFEGATAAAGFARRAAAPPVGAGLALSMASVEQGNRALLYGARPGVLAQTLAQHGRGAAVVANADVSRGPDASGYHREAALALIDPAGRLGAGELSPALLADDPAAPFGLRLDPDAVAASFSSAWTVSSVVLVELSDLARAEWYAPLVSRSAADEHRERALAYSDEIVRRLLDRVDWQRDAVVLLSPAASSRGPEQLTVGAVVVPGGAPGTATSATTRRPGYVTLADVAPTVLNVLGIRAAPAMTGTPITTRAGAVPGPSTFEELAERNRRSVFRDRVQGPTTAAFVALQVLTYALAVGVLMRRLVGMAPVTGFLALVILAAPPALFLAGLFPYHRLGAVGFAAAITLASTLLAAAAMVVGRRQPAAAPLALITLDLVVLLADVAAGARLQIDTVFGYSPVVAGRFAGYGNLAFGILAMSAIAVVTGAWGLAGRAGRRTLLPVVAFLAVVVVADGHPALGSDVGGVLALVPSFTVVALRLGGVRLSAPRLAAVAMATAVVLGGFLAADLARPAEDRTHLARLAAGVLSGEGDLATVLQRKLRANLFVFRTSIWTYVIPVAVAFLSFLLWRPPSVLRTLQERHRGLRTCLVGGLWAGVLGFLLNDSGVAVPAIMLAVVLPYLTVLAMRLAVPDAHVALVAPPGGTVSTLRAADRR